MNSLLQNHFQNYKFVKAVMEFKSDLKFTEEELKAAKRYIFEVIKKNNTHTCRGQSLDKKKARLIVTFLI